MDSIYVGRAGGPFSKKVGMGRLTSSKSVLGEWELFNLLYVVIMESYNLFDLFYTYQTFDKQPEQLLGDESSDGTNVSPFIIVIWLLEITCVKKLCHQSLMTYLSKSSAWILMIISILRVQDY